MTSRRENVLGVGVDAVDYAGALSEILEAAHESRPFAVTALAVHGLMEGVRDVPFGSLLSTFDIVAPDGQPVRWALNLLHSSGLADRVYGPELTARVVARCERERLPIYLYGSTNETLRLLSSTLRERHPGLTIAGSEPSRFGMLTENEAAKLASRINESGAKCVLVGLGCPRQESFVAAMRPLVNAPLLAVGAAFDYHAGNLKNPPAWMQRNGLEWFWRLMLEPRRLWRRYILLNPLFLALLFRQWITGSVRPIADPSTYSRPNQFNG